MTKQQFADLLLNILTICSDDDGLEELQGAKVGVFRELDGNMGHSHYIYVRLGNGQEWRLKPERALKRTDFEEEIFKELDKG